MAFSVFTFRCYAAWPFALWPKKCASFASASERGDPSITQLMEALTIAAPKVIICSFR